MSSGYIDLPVTGGGSGTGTVTEVDSGTGLTGGPITTTGTLAVNVGTSASNIPQLNANAQIALGDGSSSDPQYSFASETTTGFYRSGTGDLVLMVDGAQAFEWLKLSNGNVNFAMGPSGTISNQPNTPFQLVSTYNGNQAFEFTNENTGTSSVTTLSVNQGTSANFTTIENWANNTVNSYLGGGSALFSSPNQTQLIIGCERTYLNSGFIGFTVGGRTLATERMRLTDSALTMNAGTNMVFSSYTTVAKLALTVSAGTQVFDSTLNQMSYFNGTSWVNF